MAGYRSGEIRHGMRRVDPERFYRLCGRKERHETAAEARAAIRQMGQTGKMREYNCEWCYGWHIGHPAKGRDHDR